MLAITHVRFFIKSHDCGGKSTVVVRIDILDCNYPVLDTKLSPKAGCQAVASARVLLHYAVSGGDSFARNRSFATEFFDD
jgi:hypothetical protein